MLKADLLDIICCPACRADLSIDAAHSRLTCTKCGAQYEVKDGVPILLPPADGE